jgi:putative aminopeptidase FrvX
MAIPPFLRRLLTATGPSGQESSPARVWREAIAAHGLEVGSDSVGSSFARVAGAGAGPALAIVGHIDEIGLHVTHIEDNGHLRFGLVGGWDPAVLIAQRVTVHTRGGPVPGVIGRKPVHMLKEDERRQLPEVKDLHIDIGARDAEEARALVRIGDMAVIDAEPAELREGLVISRALDNRIGCYVAAEAARIVASEGGAAGEVVALAAAQEETGFAGSRTSAFAHRPDVAIVVDLTFATDQPGVELGPITEHKLGSGPVIARGPIIHPRVFELLHEAGEREGIPFTIESTGRSTGTDADAIHIARSGIPTGLVSVPARYMHSPVEMASLDDIAAAAKLIAAFARLLQPGMSFER